MIGDYAATGDLNHCHSMQANRYDRTLSGSKNCMEYRYNWLNTIYVLFQTLDNNVIQIRMNNQGFNAEQIKRIYIQRGKLFED
jgi:hypothetical protein